MQLHFLQNLPHHLVTAIHLLSICTVEVVGTSQQLLHLNFSKVWLAPLYSHVVSFKPIGHFSRLSFASRFILKTNSIFISDHLLRHEPCSNCWMTEWVRKLCLEIERTHLIQRMIITNFLQDLSHLLVCCKKVDIRFHLRSICTVEVVVINGRHLPHLNFLSKVCISLIPKPHKPFPLTLEWG